MKRSDFINPTLEDFLRNHLYPVDLADKYINGFASDAVDRLRLSDFQPRSLPTLRQPGVADIIKKAIFVPHLGCK
jgi:hypothetical protein